MTALAERVATAIPKLTRAELAELDALLAVPMVPDDYGEWIAQARPAFRWDAPHFVAMQAVLNRITSGELRRAYFQIPIRHGKTEHNTIGYAVYCLERDPKTRILVASYNQRQAEKFSREIRRLARIRGIPLSLERDAAGEWETVAGGGVRAIGAGAGVASVNADLILFDDPIGSRDDAESPTHRNRIWDWITNDLLARSEPHTAVIGTMSRWHDDDPGGRIRDHFGGSWHILDLPGRAEESDPLGREVGEPLWPELRGEDWHNEKELELLDYGYASLIQGRPRPREGGMYEWNWFDQRCDVPTGQLIRYWDMAGTKKKAEKRSHDPDYTASTMMGRTPAKQTVVVHASRFRVKVAERKARVVQQAIADRALYGSRVVYWFERQAGISGEEATQELVREIQALGLACYDEAVSGSKPERAVPFASAAKAGNVLLAPDDPDEPWHGPWRSEHATFPSGKHDDWADSSSGCYNKLSGAPVTGTFPFRP